VAAQAVLLLEDCDGGHSCVGLCVYRLWALF
jgi:hypothetical protein